MSCSELRLLPRWQVRAAPAACQAQGQNTAGCYPLPLRLTWARDSAKGTATSLSCAGPSFGSSPRAVWLAKLRTGAQLLLRAKLLLQALLPLRLHAVAAPRQCHGGGSLHACCRALLLQSPPRPASLASAAVVGAAALPQVPPLAAAAAAASAAAPAAPGDMQPRHPLA